MAEDKNMKKSRFLTRLMRDEAGNAIAIMAAAIVPIIGLVGGGVDVSRMYLVKAKLQAACDAGSLMGRRTMGGGAWNDDSGKADAAAKELFDANFKSGAYGTESLQRSFTEAAGNVTGTASAVVPMALMQVFGITDRTMSITCESELRIPSTDVMFVLDTTGSMNCPIASSSCGNNGNVEASNAKMKGLRTAVRCFYESLAKENITASSAADCGESADPSGGVSADVRLRFGFVPYSVNVNVGKLLPLDYMADSWSYQSREAIYDTSGSGSGYNPVYGDESDLTQSGSSSNNTGNGSWIDRPWGQNLAPTTGGYWAWAFWASNSNQCNVTLPPDIYDSYTGTANVISQNPDPVTYPDSEVTRTYERTDGEVTYEYRYKFYSYWWGKICRLQRRSTDQSETTYTFTSTQPITWEADQNFLRWDYKKVAFDVSALKDTNNNAWKQSLTLPLGNDGTGKTINWNGCIEERKTQRVNDSNPSDNWDPIPAGAIDMDIDRTPDVSDTDTQWGPMLGQAVYRRNNSSGNWTTSTRSRTDNSHWGQPNEYCPSEATTYKEWTPANFSAELDKFNAIGNTYHDIGLLWGARLMSPTGIFSATTNDDPNVVRHMVFMTDGKTQSNGSDLSAYGLNWWDRRQNDGTSGPSSAWLISNIDGRSQAVCKWIRDNNITLWVISYGDVNAATDTALKACVDNNNDRFFKATDTATLIANFKSIAESISALRLTS